MTKHTNKNPILQPQEQFQVHWKSVRSFYPREVLRNLRLYKATHSQKLLEVIGAPSGGQRTLLRSLINEELPPLMPPSNDFVSCDDNLQVKKVTSSSKLKEQFKHTVKVVNSNVYFQNTSDKLSHVLKNAQNQPDQ